MKIFITGASGFVGRNLMAHVLQRGDSVVALSRSSQATRRIQDTSSALGYTVSIYEGDLESSSPQHLSKDSKFEAVTDFKRQITVVERERDHYPHLAVAANLQPAHKVNAGMEGCNLVLHSAAKVDGMGPLKPFLATNVEGTKRILSAAKQAGVPRLVHISTEALLVRDGQPIHLANEERELQEPPFHAPYSISKLRAEQAVVARLRLRNPSNC